MIRAIFLTLTLLIAACARPPPPGPLPVLGKVPAFALTDQAGSGFDSHALDHKVWIANFVFTRCPTICPTFTAKMASIQKGTEPLGDEVQLVSFTVDPEFDTAPKLAEYAKLHQAGPRWTFLTGQRPELEAVVVKGMMQAMVKGDGSLMSIGHGSYFVLVDRQQSIRGFYRFSDEGSVEQVVRDAAALAAEK
jgi:protein SCO1/2